MKNRVCGLAFVLTLLAAGATNSACAKPQIVGKTDSTMKIVSIDSIRLLRESSEGQQLENTIKGQVAEFESFVKKANTDIMAEQESITKQAAVLSKDALQEKQVKLARTKKEMEHKIVTRRDELTQDIQQQQVKLREKQLEIAQELREKNGWTLMLEKNAPFVLGVAPAIDKTEEVLKVVNTRFAKNKTDDKKAAVVKA